MIRSEIGLSLKFLHLCKVCPFFLQKRHIMLTNPSLELVVSVFAPTLCCLWDFSGSACFSDCSEVTGLQAIFTSLVRNFTNWLNEGNWFLSSSSSTTFRFHPAVNQSGNFDRFSCFHYSHSIFPVLLYGPWQPRNFVENLQTL